MDNTNHIIPVHSSHFYCIFKLTQRRLLVFYRDRTDLFISFGQAPILALSFFFVFTQFIAIDSSGVSPDPTTIDLVKKLFIPLRSYLAGSDGVGLIIFLVVLTAVWFGTSKAIIEIPSSKNLYRQEQLSFLKNIDYLFSIFISLSIIAFFQVFFFCGVFYILFMLIPAFVNPVETGLLLNESSSASLIDILMPVLLIKFVVLMWIVSMAAIAFAMFLSVFISTPAAASAILPFVLILQILMGGSAIQPVLEMNKVIRPASNLMVSRWGFEATILLFEQKLNFNMERFKQRDETFSSFSFTGKVLRKTKKNDYLKYINKKMDGNRSILPEITIENYTILNLWYTSLIQALDPSDYNSINQDATDKEKEILEQKKDLKEEIEGYKKRLTHIADDKGGNQMVITEYKQLKEKNLPGWIINRATKFFIGSSSGSYMEKVEVVFSNLNEENTIAGKEILSHAMSSNIDPELKLFRINNSLKTWGVLYLIIGTFLTLTLLFFNKTRKKEKMLF